MNRKVIVLNILLLALAGWLGWMVRKSWLEADARQRGFLTQSARAKALAAAPNLPPVERPVAANYLDIDQRTLFARDRNSTVIVDAPPAPAPPPPVPPLPVYHGQMNFGEPVLILSTGQSDQKSYRKGDAVGKFKLVAFDRENVTLEWDGKDLEHKLTDLAPKEAQAIPSQVALAPTAAPAAPVTSLAASAPRNLGGNDAPQLGVDMGGPRACVAGDNSPAGTVLNGYKKVVVATLMGQSCHWEPLNR
jgi:hypothetical protein